MNTQMDTLKQREQLMEDIDSICDDSFIVTTEIYQKQKNWFASYVMPSAKTFTN